MSAASERAFFDFFETHNSVFCGVNREVAADVSAFASDFCAAGLAHENFACGDCLATKALDAEARTSVVVDVLA